MEGPQSNIDVEMYRQAAGDIANPNIPADTRKAAIVTIRTLNEKYANPNQAQGQNAPTQMMPTPEQAMEILRQRGRKF
jgi:RecA/RadA recombinase